MGVILQKYRRICILIQVFLLMKNCHCCDGGLLRTTQAGHKLDSPGQMFTAMGQKQCVRECMRRGDCLSVNYWRSDLRCQLNPSAVGPGVALVPDSLCDYIEKMTQPQELIHAACLSASCPYRCTMLSSGVPTCVSDSMTGSYYDR
nr:uncharacterized protein LOC117691766 [Crassostrea gigas]